MNMLNEVFTYVTIMFRNILSFPFQLVFIALGVPNVRIILKSGRKIDLLLKVWSCKTKEGKIVSMRWTAGSISHLSFLDPDEIAAIVELY